MASRIVFLALVAVALVCVLDIAVAQNASLPEQAPPMVESAPSILVTEDTAVEEADGHDQIKLSPSCTVRCGFAHACQFKGGNCAFPKDCACDRFWFDKA